MQTQKNLRKKHRPLRVESLEQRELMAANVTASLSNGVLNIEGTNGNDTVSAYVSSSGKTVVQNLTPSGFRVIFESTSKPHTINAKMLDGRDKINLTGFPGTLNSVNVDMGRGNSESVYLGFSYTKRLNINAVKSVSTKVHLARTVVDQAIVDFGKDSGRDTFIASSCSLNGMDIRMGKGDDVANFSRTSIRNSKIKMGAGNDQVFIDSSSDATNSTLHGGPGSDLYKKTGSKASNLKLRSIETLR